MRWVEAGPKAILLVGRWLYTMSFDRAVRRCLRCCCAPERSYVSRRETRRYAVACTACPHARRSAASPRDAPCQPSAESWRTLYALRRGGAEGWSWSSVETAALCMCEPTHETIACVQEFGWLQKVSDARRSSRCFDSAVASCSCEKAPVQRDGRKYVRNT